ncbi:MAG: peptide deformylase [Gammaproteobacteria bacterium]|nr:peptide deformylase [Gammaproteobacteria bacterium]
MALLTILEHPDPRLRLHAEPVTRFDADLGQLVDDLLETLYASKAIGLCAQQANDLRQVIVMDLSGEAAAPQVYINPSILAGSRPGMVEESCLSVPGVVASVARNTRIRVRAQDRTGEFFERDLEGMDAVCLQHEMDHLVGTLFVDRLSWLRRQLLRWSQNRASA